MHIEIKNQTYKFDHIFDNAPRGGLCDIKYNEKYPDIVTRFTAIIYDKGNNTIYLHYENDKFTVEDIILLSPYY